MCDRLLGCAVRLRRDDLKTTFCAQDVRQAFRWTLYDKRTGTLEAGYIVTPTFELSRAHFAEDILVKFDESGKVSLVSRTVSDGENVRITEWKEHRK